MTSDEATYPAAMSHIETLSRGCKPLTTTGSRCHSHCPTLVGSPAAANARLLDRLIGLFVGFALHPSSIGEECDDAEPDDEDNTEHENDARVLGGPVVPFTELAQVGSLRPVDQTDSSHGALGCGRAEAIVVTCLVCQSLRFRQSIVSALKNEKGGSVVLTKMYGALTRLE